MKNVKFIILVFTQFTFAVNFYVSPSGNDNNDGLTIINPFQTIEKAAYSVAPGDTVFIRSGIYSKNYPESLIVFMTISGTFNNPITYRNYPGENPILQMNNSNWGAIKLNGCDYIIIDGLTIIGNNDNITLQYAQSQQAIIGNPATAGNGIMIDSEYNNAANKPHHNIVRNCNVYKCCGGGIYSYNADYTTIENNIVSQCGWYTPYGNSGISMYQNWNSDANTGFKNFINGNTCFRNENFIPWYVTNSILDGNGIIIDDNRNTQNNSTLGIYSGKTYISNNLIFDNGARGIHCFESDNVLVINNTCFQNCQSPTTREGELTAINASNITFVNNIVSPSTNVPPINQFGSTNVSAENNLFMANENLSNPLGTNTILGNAVFVNPTANYASANFHLLQNCNAIGTGSSTNAPITDKDGIVRLTDNLIDIGCYEYTNSLGLMKFNANKITLYPNPAKNYFSITNPENSIQKNLKIEIINIFGQKVQEIIIENYGVKIEIYGLKTGIYLVNVVASEIVFSSKLLIE